MRVALIGSAPSSVRLAPYTDPEWKIWACSPGSVQHLKRMPDAFFELHRWEPEKSWFCINYRTWLANAKCPIYMIDPVPQVPASIAYPKDEMVRKFGPWFFTSSLSWMFALAIHQGATEIGLWGVDMSAQEEWEFQRSGCHFFIALAREMGIKVTIPHESDLLRPPPFYGFREVDPMHIKLLARNEELEAKVREAQQKQQAARDEQLFYQGALDANKYTLKTWVGDGLALQMAYSNPEPKTAEATLMPAQIEASGEAVAAAIEAKAEEKVRTKTPKVRSKPRKVRTPRRVNGAAHAET